MESLTFSFNGLSYSMSEVGQKPGGPHARGAAAERSYPTSEVKGGGREELCHV